MKTILATLLGLLLLSTGLHAAPLIDDANETNIIEELNPFDANIEQTLNLLDMVYEATTGESAHLEEPLVWNAASGCKRESCAVYAYVSRAKQRLYLYINGQIQYTWKVSTGTASHPTPYLEGHPNGRIYNKYTSTKYPEGDYNGLGNMPYAVFIRGGFAIHGTTRGNFKRLGTRASHGCIRVHPDNGRIFNKLVRSYGKRNVWILVN